MRQRLGIAQALVGRPAVILLDEPVSALDPIGRKDVLELMHELKGETTVFYSTHILDDVQRVSDHVAILDHGRLVKAAPTQVLLGSFTKNTLGSSLAAPTRTRRSASASSPGVATVTIASRDGATTTYDVTTAEGASADVQRAITGFAVDARPDPHQQLRGDARSRDRLPAPDRPEGGGGMTAQSVALGPHRPGDHPRRHVPRIRNGLPQGDHASGSAAARAIVVGVGLHRSAVFTTRHPVHRGDRRPPAGAAPVDGSDRQRPARLERPDRRDHRPARDDEPDLRRAGSRHAGLEPDQPGLADQHPRGQVAGGRRRLRHRRRLHPARRLQSLVATVVYGGLPDLATIGLFGALYLTVPAFYIALTVALGTVDQEHRRRSPASASS